MRERGKQANRCQQQSFSTLILCFSPHPRRHSSPLLRYLPDRCRDHFTSRDLFLTRPSRYRLSRFSFTKTPLHSIRFSNGSSNSRRSAIMISCGSFLSWPLMRCTPHSTTLLRIMLSSGHQSSHLIRFRPVNFPLPQRRRKHPAGNELQGEDDVARVRRLLIQ